ncbi:DUF4376 domain-containing protein [Moraxella catarrhalis]|uniref:DUF4376 domain-containing protein n=1 Tax=Moraxella catarrhalis TaxID=480 RepID=UPI00071EEA08|nr:DUF4376 domain-containing protein [Moraxella catarrhalis]AKI28075.1 tail protein [Moraxella phage Mcat25]AKI28127.1 tail protein [Moraxella phage Mcat26]AKI28264.1 tail protein [Moraxella phage Mcat28]AKI28313.1 tail protein [Moraxella phage Mcat29]MDE4520110.1 DUF4376 domain-containing protein [Moraxella catarrhalis]
MHYIKLIDDKGHFEFIHEDFLYLYSDTADFIAIAQEDYQTYVQSVNQELIYQHGKIISLTNQISADEIKQTNQELVWSDIKDKRTKHTHSGVYIASVDKWFHTDESSRIQYLALITLPSLPDNLQWKTMDNSFITLTRPLLTELTSAMLIKEQQDFMNAERHKQLMMRVDNPLDYDYSDGWSAIYA